MKNVCRIFNDPQGAELCERTGRNPAYTYLSLGCSKSAEARMLAFARQQIGKPFSNMGMARSLIAPRRSDGSSWFCAELVAAVLKVGALMSTDSNPGAATPYSLYKLYSKQAAATANPYTLRSVTGLTFNSMTAAQNGARAPLLQRDAGPQFEGMLAMPRPLALSSPSPAGRKRSDSPPRAAFKVLSASGHSGAAPGLTLSLHSLSAGPSRWQ